MKKKWNVVLAKFLIVLFFISIGGIGSAVYAAAPNDENYDDDAGYSSAGTSFTIDGIRYTLTGPGPDTLVTNVAPSGWGELGDGGADNFISIMGIDTLKIEAADGSYFKLNGFEMGFCSVGGVTITPEAGSAITRARAGDESYYSIDVSANTDFQYIRYFTIAGTDMIMNIDDLDFSPAVSPTHTVSYNGNGNTGGSAPTDGSSPYTEGDTVTVLGNSGTLVKTGYTFAGWNTAANGSGTSYAPAATFAMGTSDITLYAQWAPLYTVTYNGNSNTGGSVPTDGNSYLNGAIVTVLDNTGTLVRTGYTFAGWNTAANGSGTSRVPASTFAMGTSNVTLYAQWTPIDYAVTYNGNTNTGGAVPSDATVYHITDTVTVLGNTGNLVKTGYTFAGWNTAANGSGTSYAPAASFTIGSGNVTLYAQWTENTYTVTYNGNGNTGGAVPTDATSYHMADTATVLGNTGTLVRTGYTFAGWNTAAGGSGTSYAGSDTFAIGTSNVTLYAQWTPIDYAVTYNGNTNTGGAAPTDATVYHITDTVTVLGNSGTLVKTGYSFAGWNTAANGSGTSYAPAATFAIGSGNVTLYAQWTENTYTVTYNGNGNTGGAVPTDATSYHMADTATVLGNTGTLVRTGYTFAGWNTAAGGSGTSYAGSDTFAIGTSNVTLYAQWTPIDYAVTYNGNTNTGGAVPTDATVYHITDTVIVLGNSGTLVKTGYSFAGWNTAANGSGTSYAPAATFAIGSGNVTLYAQWTENTYTVTYNGNGNTGGAVPTDATSYHMADTATVLGNTGTLVRTGYTFAGWNTAAGGSGTSYAGSDTFAIGTSNVTLYAQWTPIDYAVTYNGNTNTGGAVPTDATVYHITDTVIVLGNTGNLVKTGYTFAGWNTAANAGGTMYSPGNTFAMGGSNVTFYAQWTENTSNGGSSTSTTGQPSQETVIVIVNGQELNAGTETTTTEAGKTTVTVTVDNKVIESKIEEAIEDNTTGTGNVIQITIADTKAEVAKVELTGDIVKKLEENSFDVSVKYDNVEYVIPAEEFNISKVAENLGVSEKDLQDIKVEIKITKLDEKVVEKYNEVAKANGAELVFPPVSFEVAAKTTKVDGTSREVEISKFSNYVEMIMEIPAGVDPSKITTGIVFNPDGTYSPVPTEVFPNDGKWYAKLKSLTNSEYSVIWNPITVKSVENHWSKDAVNDMASRLVIFNPETFVPDNAITRADFAGYIVRALGLYREGSIYVNKFSDVSATGDRTLAILIASEYEIVAGYPDGTFRPDSLITREEAMTMYQRAMTVTKLTGSDITRHQNYTDFAQVSDWASSPVKEVLAAHVFNGTSTTTISPKSNLTYAEAAQAIKNLLVASKLINK